MKPVLLALLCAAVAIGALLATVVLAVVEQADVVYSILSLLAILPYVVTGFLVAWRRPSNAIGWFVLALPISFGTAVFLGQYALLAPAEAVPFAAAAQWGAFWLWVPGWLALGLVFLLFPDGRLPSARWRPVVRTIVAATAMATVVAAVSNDPRGTPTGRPNPLALDAPLSLYYVAIALLLVVFILPAVSLVARYRLAGGQVRRQLKWLAYGASVLVLISFTYLVGLREAGSVAGTRSADVLFLVGISAPAIAIGIAILRDRVFDIDVLIGRTLVYGVLSAVLAATYTIVVVALQTLLRPLTGGSEIAVAGSTLAVVALIQPVRRRTQAFVDRRFYRSRYDAARTVDAFISRMRDQVDIDAVRDDVIEVVGATVRPAHASVWLRAARNDFRTPAA